MKRVVLSVTVLAGLFLGAPLTLEGSASEEPEGGQPIEELFFTETVYPQEQGELQLTLRPAYSAGAPEGDRFALGITAEYGITDHLQMETSWAAYQVTDPEEEEGHQGPGDVEVGVKYAFPRVEALGLQAAVGFSVTFPTGDIDKELTEGFIVYEPFVILSKDFGSGSNLHLSAAYGVLSRQKRPDAPDAEEELEPEADEVEVSAGFIHPWGGWRLTLELSLESNEVQRAGEDTQLLVVPGIVWTGRGPWEAGVGVALGLTADSPDWAVVGLITYEFALLPDG